MKYSVLLAALLAASMTACGQKEEAAAPAEPVVEEVAPMEVAPTVDEAAAPAEEEAAAPAEEAVPAAQ